MRSDTCPICGIEPKYCNKIGIHPEINEYLYTCPNCGTFFITAEAAELLCNKHYVSNLEVKKKIIDIISSSKGWPHLDRAVAENILGIEPRLKIVKKAGITKIVFWTIGILILIVIAVSYIYQNIGSLIIGGLLLGWVIALIFVSNTWLEKRNDYNEPSKKLDIGYIHRLENVLNISLLLFLLIIVFIIFGIAFGFHKMIRTIGSFLGSLPQS